MRVINWTEGLARLQDEEDDTDRSRHDRAHDDLSVLALALQSSVEVIDHRIVLN